MGKVNMAAAQAEPAVAKGAVPAKAEASRKTGGSDLKEVAKRVNALHGEIVRSDTENLKKAVEIGTLCRRVKDGLKKAKTWMSWVAKELEFTSKTANAYVLVADAFDAGKLKGATGLSQAYYALGVLNDAKKEQRTRTSRKLGSFAFRQAAVEEITSRVKSLLNGRGSLPEIEVKAQQLKDLRGGVLRAVAEHGKDLLASGGIIIVSPSEQAAGAGK